MHHLPSSPLRTAITKLHDYCWLHMMVDGSSQTVSTSNLHSGLGTESEYASSLAGIEPNDPLYEEIEGANGQKKRVRVRSHPLHRCNPSEH